MNRRKIVNDTVIRLNTIVKGMVSFQDDVFFCAYIITIQTLDFTWNYRINVKSVNERLIEVILSEYKHFIMERYIKRY